MYSQVLPTGPAVNHSASEGAVAAYNTWHTVVDQSTRFTIHSVEFAIRPPGAPQLAVVSALSDRSPSHLDWSGISSRGTPLCGGSTVPRRRLWLGLNRLVTSYSPWTCTTAAGSCLCYGVVLITSAARLHGDLQRESGF